MKTIRIYIDMHEIKEQKNSNKNIRIRMIIPRKKLRKKNFERDEEERETNPLMQCIKSKMQKRLIYAFSFNIHVDDSVMLVILCIYLNTNAPMNFRLILSVEIIFKKNSKQNWSTFYAL